MPARRNGLDEPNELDEPDEPDELDAFGALVRASLILMVAVASQPGPIPAGEYVPTADRRVSLRVPWSHFEVMLALRGDVAGPRMAYLNGVMELMSPSKGHEQTKSYVGRLLEVYALERDITLSPYGAWTLKESREEVGAEPDECYIVGPDQKKNWPDLVIEVIWTSGSIDKLEIYRRLGIGEAWFWKDSELSLYVLVAGHYQRVDRSRVFPDLDIKLLCSFLDRPSATDAMRGFRDALRAAPAR